MSRPDKRQRERERQQRRAERRAQDAGGQPHAKTGAQPRNAGPVRGATAPMIDEAKRWHLARTTPLLGPIGRQRLNAGLEKLAVPAYRPRVSEVVVRRGRRVVRHVPLLIRTLIIGVDDDAHLRRVIALPGVAEIVSHPEPDGTARGNVEGMVLRPARLDAKALQAFLIALAAGEITQPTGLCVGQSVVVVDGPFASFPATVTEILPNDLIRADLAIFGRPTSAVLGIAQVQAA